MYKNFIITIKHKNNKTTISSIFAINEKTAKNIILHRCDISLPDIEEIDVKKAS